jgi:hypothetical protein
VWLQHQPYLKGTPKTDDMMILRAVVEKAPDADLLRELRRHPGCGTAHLRREARVGFEAVSKAIVAFLAGDVPPRPAGMACSTGRGLFYSETYNGELCDPFHRKDGVGKMTDVLDIGYPLVVLAIAVGLGVLG